MRQDDRETTMIDREGRSNGPQPVMKEGEPYRMRVLRNSCENDWKQTD